MVVSVLHTTRHGRHRHQTSRVHTICCGEYRGQECERIQDQQEFQPGVTWKTVIGPEVNRTHDSVCIILTVIYLSKFKLSDSRFGVDQLGLLM